MERMGGLENINKKISLTMYRTINGNEKYILIALKQR